MEFKKKSRKYFVVGNAYFSAEIWSILEKCIEFKNDCNFHRQVRFQYFAFVFRRRHSFKPLAFIELRCQSFHRGWSSEGFAGGNVDTCGRMKKTEKDNPNPERGERSCTTEYRPLHSDLKRVQDETGWRRLAATFALWQEICQWWYDTINDNEHLLKWPGFSRLKYILVQWLTWIILIYYRYKSE